MQERTIRGAFVSCAFGLRRKSVCACQGVATFHTSDVSCQGLGVDQRAKMTKIDKV